MTIQLSDCCKATIDLDKTKERPECYTCSKCGRIIGSPLSTHNTRELEKDLIKLIIDAVWEATDGGVKMSEHQFYHFEELNGAINTFLETHHQELQKAREEERERIINQLEDLLLELDSMDALGIATPEHLGERIGLGKAKAITRNQSELDQPTV